MYDKGTDCRGLQPGTKLARERQAYAAEILLLLEAQNQSPAPVSDEEWKAIQEGNAQAERGEFVSDEDMAAFYKRHGL